MEKKLVFALDEYRRRIRRTRERMDAEGLEVLLTLDPANMNYLTGYDGWSFYVYQGVILGLEEGEPVWFGRQQDSNGARITTWLAEENIRGYPDPYVQSRTTHAMSWVAGLLQELGWGERKIGVEMDGYWFSARCLEQLRRDLPHAVFQDATCLVNWVRAIKSEVEIAVMRQAARICEKVMRTAIAAVEEDVWEKEAAARTVAAQVSGTEEYGGDYPAILPLMPAAERTTTAHMTYDPDRRYRHGDVVFMELAGCRRRYHAPLSRTVYLGEPPKKLQTIAAVVVNGLQQTLDFIRPGVAAEEVEARWRESLKGTGVEKPSRVGYSFGLNYVPDWGEHTISLRPGDKTLLRPGMTLHFMPGIWLEEFGFECSEPILVTESGCDKLVDFPEQLFVKRS